MKKWRLRPTTSLWGVGEAQPMEQQVTDQPLFDQDLCVDLQVHCTVPYAQAPRSQFRPVRSVTVESRYPECTWHDG
ncbi:unnamed protein product, partial [Mesorhabditis spiculigera]